jgi:hypothetical protein
VRLFCVKKKKNVQFKTDERESKKKGEGEKKKNPHLVRSPRYPNRPKSYSLSPRARQFDPICFASEMLPVAE